MGASVATTLESRRPRSYHQKLSANAAISHTRTRGISTANRCTFVRRGSLVALGASFSLIRHSNLAITLSVHAIEYGPCGFHMLEPRRFAVASAVLFASIRHNYQKYDPRGDKAMRFVIATATALIGGGAILDHS